MNVLIVEDNSAIARAVTKALRGYGHVTTSVGSAEQARASGTGFDVGVFDISLPDGDGIELAEELRSKGAVRHILFFSGSVDDYMIERAEKAGRVLPKQQSFADLHRVLLEVGGR